ncbi:Flp family type IVb pilin [Sphingomonas japonica]|uniref:Pilus assembly protein Flp/PilA n=1 Tax=Sphingomonas japonica TaxID=511662 RepID=A0ABX0U3B5_9SPHN|nr:Flp family type IVb pilin [Sphingomonas japonica]NIJ24988.1 pilus assembly protein Flp/PilA [Sphingomonas japonica]
MTGEDSTVRPERPRLPAILRDRKGATAVEYGLIVALIVIAIIASIQGVASATIGMWDDVDTKVTEATT